MPDPGSCPGRALTGLPRHVVSRGQPVSFWIALKLYFVPRLRGNDYRGVFTRQFNNTKERKPTKWKDSKGF
jgi:hypothetical protein